MAEAGKEYGVDFGLTNAEPIVSEAAQFAPLNKILSAEERMKIYISIAALMDVGLSAPDAAKSLAEAYEAAENGGIAKRVADFGKWLSDPERKEGGERAEVNDDGIDGLRAGLKIVFGKNIVTAEELALLPRLKAAGSGPSLLRDVVAIMGIRRT